MKTYHLVCILPDGSAGYLKPGRPGKIEVTTKSGEAERFAFFTAADMAGFSLREDRQVKLYNIARMENGRAISLSA